MANSIYSLTIAAFLPVLVTAVLYLLDRKTAFGRINYWIRQVIFGILFGGLAILGTEWGIPIAGAQANCRDAAVLAAGLLFGAPAGILAGLIGGIERWFAVAWGVGSYTRLACSLATVFCGLYSAVLRKYMFEEKRPWWLISFCVGVVAEIIHLSLVFLTHMSEPLEAMAVVKACTVPLIASNSVSVMLATMAANLVSGESLDRGKGKARIFQTIQEWLLLTIIFALLLTSFFVFRMQDTMADTQTDSMLSLAIDGIANDIRDASDENLLRRCRDIRDILVEGGIENYDLSELAWSAKVAEICVVDRRGIIVASNEKNYIGFDMASGAQSSAFLCLLGATEEMVQDYGPISIDRYQQRKFAGVRTDNGFIQVGYDAEHFQKEIAGQVVGLTKNRNVGQTGFILIMDEKGTLVSAPQQVSIAAAASAQTAIAGHPEDETFEAEIAGARSFCRYRRAEGYYIISALPRTEALQLRNVAFYVNAFLEILLFALLFAQVDLLTKRVVVDPIRTVNASLEKITAGNLNEVVNVHSHEEFALLSNDINATVDTLKQYIEEASARLDEELHVAKDIQSSALPSIFPAFPKRTDLDIFACMDPAKEVGGDFYDFYISDSDTLNFLVADVSGKGIPAAMFMMRAKTELKTLTEAGLPLSEVFTEGNNALCEGNDANMFVTAWQGSLDLMSGTIRFVNAGHNPPLLRRDGKFEYLKSRAGFVLAGMEEFPYQEQEVRLEPGDVVFLYTDGVTEATNADNKLYGEERLLNTLNFCGAESMAVLCRTVRADVEAFVGDAPQFDDITMLAVKYIGTPPPPEISFEHAGIEAIEAVTEFLETELEKADCPMKIVMQLNVVVDEIVSNIIHYGYPQQDGGPLSVRVILKDNPRRVYLRFTDHGIPYNPLMRADPDVKKTAEEREVGGLGIYMVKKMTDSIKYKYEDDCNILTVMKLISE